MEKYELNPWLIPYWERLKSAYKQHRFPHALLLTGQPGMGKTAFADWLARFLLCESPLEGAAPCGQCAGCTLHAAGNNPDFFPVTRMDDSKEIKVNQIRELSAQLSLTRHGAAMRVVIVTPAEAMNIHTSNSLLKTLEEPSDNTVLLLVSANPARLPATIRSRCQQVGIKAPDRGLVIKWLSAQCDAPKPEVYLQLANGAPLQALELARGNALEERRECFKALVGIHEGRQNPLALAEKWAREDDLRELRWLREWLMDLLRIRLSGQVGGIHGIDLTDGLQALAQQLDSRIMFGQLDKVNRMFKLADSSLNRQLMMEDVLLAWANRSF